MLDDKAQNSMLKPQLRHHFPFISYSRWAMKADLSMPLSVFEDCAPLQMQKRPSTSKGAYSLDLSKKIRPCVVGESGRLLRGR